MPTAGSTALTGRLQHDTDEHNLTRLPRRAIRFVPCMFQPLSARIGKPVSHDDDVDVVMITAKPYVLQQKSPRPRCCEPLKRAQPKMKQEYAAAGARPGAARRRLEVKRRRGAPAKRSAGPAKLAPAGAGPAFQHPQNFEVLKLPKTRKNCHMLNGGMHEKRVR